ncbi:hypothetical protein I2I05_20220 [Hymenobacter sp. BT683]|uniref:DUF3592 domain-containing protein n=1 Tax=Hymenobacter jeongseonensis TaxID=2791027 RepID=A0ABS0IMX2_9BACT|nr:hypothetical protein [Hymenobacter jeongseonensis]MBF9239730.1 hypothetical protein [Hymenobacter jeongseonensis]
MTKSISGVLIRFVLLLLGSAWLAYRTWPVYALHLLYQEADASVGLLPDGRLHIRFFNAFENHETSVTRPLWTGERFQFVGPVLRVRYAWACPDAVVVYGLDNIPAFWLPALLQLAFLFTLFVSGKQAVNVLARRAEPGEGK